MPPLKFALLNENGTDRSTEKKDRWSKVTFYANFESSKGITKKLFR